MNSPSMMSDLQNAVASHSAERRSDNLRKVTDLFVGGAPKYSEEQVALFDGVIGQLAKDADVSARTELSARLAPISNAPLATIERLANDDSVAVAGPILKDSARLSEAQLTKLASTKGQGHLQAIAGRRDIGADVTDALLTRGDGNVARAVAGNASARVSEKGFDKIAELATRDPKLAESVVGRPDIPSRHLRTLATLLPEPIRQRLAANNPKLAERIRAAVAQAAESAAQAVRRDYTAAKDTVTAMAKAGTLADASVMEFAKAEQFEEAVVALAALVQLPITSSERIFTNEPVDTLLIAAKSADLTWPTVKSLLLVRTASRLSPQDIEDARINFVRLKPEMAKQGIRLYKMRSGAA
jgi:uncharacterized protein (DUF2336 family)